MIKDNLTSTQRAEAYMRAHQSGAHVALVPTRESSEEAHQSRPFLFGFDHLWNITDAPKWCGPLLGAFGITFLTAVIYCAAT